MNRELSARLGFAADKIAETYAGIVNRYAQSDTKTFDRIMGRVSRRRAFSALSIKWRLEDLIMREIDFYL